MKNIRIIIITAFIPIFSLTAKAQFIEDALRFALPNGIINARAGGLGVAYSGIADDYAALYYNPAGLTLVPKSEMVLGLQLSQNQNTADFLSTQFITNSNSTSLNHLGVVGRVDTKKKNISIGIGYGMESDFNNDYRVSAINPSSSIVSYWVHRNGATDAASLAVNPAYQLYLADIPRSTGTLKTPIQGNVLQEGYVQERGGLHSITGGAAFDLAPTISAGFSLSGKWGKYSYLHSYTESDVNNLYTQLDTANFDNVDFKSLSVEEIVNQDISGFSAMFGIQGRFEDILRFGLTIKTPSFYRIEEAFSQKATSTFDSHPNATYSDEGKDSYTVTTPFVFGAGISAHALGATVSASVEYSDISQLAFGDAPVAVERLNLRMAQELQGQTKWGVGAEYDFPVLPLVLRGGFTSVSAAYKNDIAGAETKIVSLGAGFYFAPNVRVDMMYQSQKNSFQRANYGGTESQYRVNSQSGLFGMQFTYRF